MNDHAREQADRPTPAGICCTTAARTEVAHGACGAGHPHHHAPAVAPPSAHAHHATGTESLAALTSAATLHCLVGCAIGEFIGLAVGVSFGLGPWTTMALATALGFVSGFALTLVPLMRRGLSFATAWRSIWLGETLSIGAMELAMNFADYHVGGVTATGLADPMFWAGYAVAIPAGFAVAWPVNYWMLGRNIKPACH
jgi:hypothetical protein